MNFENTTPEQYKKPPLVKAQGRLVNINDFNNNQKRFYILPRYFPKPTEKDKLAQWKVSMEVAASTYISQDLNISTLLKDCRELLSLNYTPDCIILNDTRKKVTDLKSIPSGTFLYVKRDVEPQFKPKKVRLFRNSTILKDGKLYHTKKGGIDQLLKDSKILLKFQDDEEPKKLYLSNGEQLRDLNSLPDDMTTHIIVCLDQEDLNFYPNNDDTNSKLSEVKSETPFVEQSDDIHNYIIGMSNISVEKAKNFAKCAAFQMLTERERRIHPEAKKIRQIMKGTHQQGFNQQMVTQMMIPPVANEFITNAMVRRSIEILEDNELGNIRFVISGARGSGKSSFLYVFANTLVRKLRLCDEEFSYLLFPINFEKYSLFKNDPLQLYNLFIETGFESANYTRFEFIRYSNILKQYLLQLPVQMNTKKPPIKFKEFEAFSNEVVKCFQNEGKNIASILQKFPLLLAEALKLQNVILIIDHFDEFESEFCSEFSKVFSKSCFILSTKDDKKFYSVFKKTKVDFIYTENLLKPRDERVLSIPELKLQLTSADCFGSPGYLASFTEICDLIENFNDHIQTDQSSRGKFHNIRARAEISRKLFIREKLFNLCVSLFSANSKIIKSLTLNGLGDVSESNFTFQLTGTVDRDLLVKANSDSEEEEENSYPPNYSQNNSPTNNSRRSSINNSPDDFNNSKNGSRNNSPDNFNNSKRGSRNSSPSNYNNRTGSRNNSPDNFNNSKKGSRNNSPDLYDKKGGQVSSPSNFNNSRNKISRRTDFDSSGSYDNNNNNGFDYDDDYDDNIRSPRNNRQTSQMINVDNNTRGRGIRQTNPKAANKQLNQRTSNLRSSLDDQQNSRASPNANVNFAPASKQGQQRFADLNNSLRSSNNSARKQAPSLNDSIRRRKSDFDSTSSDD